MGMIDLLFDWLVKSRPSGAAKPLEQKKISQDLTDTGLNSILSVLVADLSGPGGSAASDRITDGFRALEDVTVHRLNQAVSFPGSTEGYGGADGLMAAEEQCRDWLFQLRADVLVWGAVDNVTKGLSLRFISLNPAPEGRAGAMGTQERLDIPEQYSSELESVIIASALAVGGPMRTGPKAAAIKALHERASHVRALVKSGLESLSPIQRLSVLAGIGNIVAADGVATGASDTLSTAVEIYSKAVQTMPAETDSLQQAALHWHLAGTLLALASDSSTETESLEQAVESCQASVNALDENRHARDWAQAQIRLGLATYRYAIRSGQAKLLKESVVALRKSLGVFSKAVSPGKWAEVMNQIGVIMTAMGEEINNDVILQQAMKVFNETLSVRKRETTATLWAQTTNNMGAAAFALGKRSRDKALMEKAALAFEGAAEVYREVGQNKRVHVIEKNLNLVQRRLEVM